MYIYITCMSPPGFEEECDCCRTTSAFSNCPASESMRATPTVEAFPDSADCVCVRAMKIEC